MPNNYLTHAGEYFKSRKVTVRYIDDDRGRYAFHCAIPGADGYKSDAIVTAKEYLVTRPEFDGKKAASFMKRKVLKRASDMGAVVVQYVARSDSWLVFEPDAILEHGIEPDDRSRRKRNGEDWLEIPRDWGVPMDGFLDRKASPKTGPDQAAVDPDASSQKGLGRWS